MHVFVLEVEVDAFVWGLLDADAGMVEKEVEAGWNKEEAWGHQQQMSCSFYHC